MANFASARTTNEAAPARRSLAPVRVWLYVMAGMVSAMVLVGGATRLTDSGLSITEWLPVRGILPPMSEAAWAEAFAKYQQIPEYQLVNSGMSLAAFKFIYWWEWGHRLLGRAIGLAFLIPFLVFAGLGLLRRQHMAPLIGLFVLGGVQGAVGWWMVRSGLVDRVDVSQVRLAVHLTLACVIFAAIIWVALTLDRPRSPVRALPSRRIAAGILALLFVQIFAGGMVAGLDAGLSHNTWPLMDGALVPSGLFVQEPAWLNLVENVRTVQFNHRILAYLLVALVAVHAWREWRRDASGAALAFGLPLIVAAQAGLGILTLLSGVRIDLALAHQAGALIAIAAATINLAVCYGFSVTRRPGVPPPSPG